MLWKSLQPLYSGACPNCGGLIGADRLEKGIPCSRCLPGNYTGLPGDFYSLVEFIGKKLAERGRLQGYSLLYSTIKETRSFSSFFRKVVGHDLWSAQLTWARRLLSNESLAIVAPTGVGKSTLLGVYSLYRALEGAKVYYLLPTENLVVQTLSKLEAMSSRVEAVPKIVGYYSGLSRRIRESVLEDIANGSYNILVTTTSFLSRRWSILGDKFFNVIIVDDVDAVLRNSKNIDKLLQLLGFNEEVLQLAMRLIKAKMKLLIAKVSGNMRKYLRLLEEIEEVESTMASKLANVTPGQLVIASATGRVRGIKPKLFRELLGFEIGRVYDYTRSVANFYLASSRETLLRDTIRVTVELGSGGLVFVARRYGRNLARLLVEELNKNGIRAGLAISGSRVLDKFEAGDYDVLVGMASYYGVIVRGLDMPHRVVYTVFVGAPSMSLEADKILTSPFTIARLAMEMGIEGNENIVKVVSKLAPGEQTALRIALANKQKLEGRLEEVRSMLDWARRTITRRLYAKLCADGGMGQLILGGLLFKCVDGIVVAIVPDPATYVQASGRSSRMLGSYMTHGVSIIVEEEPLLIELLKRKLTRFIEELEFIEFDERKVALELSRARKSREMGRGVKKVNIETSLIIVESPTKARTIASFFGRPVKRKLGSIVIYETTFYNKVSGKIHVAAITASLGHIYDLSMDNEGVYGVVTTSEAVKPVYKPVKRCLNCGYDFSSDSNTCPRCGSTNIVTKEEVIAALRQLASEMEIVYLATDPDIEGEKIAYDLYVSLKPYARMIKRIELHEITRKELEKALAKPRDINRRMVEAQIVRRIEDRWIGFGLSQKLWERFNKNWLGAGRVQTPVLGWIVDRYEEWRRRRGYNLYVKVRDGPILRIYYPDSATARKAAETLTAAGIRVIEVKREVREIHPPPPYTTESLIYDASRLYGYTAQKTMKVAQDLFEAGLITYHRTESTYVSSFGQSIARKYLEERGLEGLNTPRSWGTPGHHEAIRPTRPLSADELRRRIASGEVRVSLTLRESHYRIYDIIFRRFMASQMKPALLEHLTLIVNVAGDVHTLEVYTKPVYKGFLELYSSSIRFYEEMSKLKEGAVIDVEVLRVKPGSMVQLYTHGELIRLMKERGLGRPSTYTRIIDSIMRHGYVIESKYRKKLIPTRLGIEVYSYLAETYSELVSEERTRKLHERIDSIIDGAYSAVSVISELYTELEEIVKQTIMSSYGEEESLATM